jgi:drug/metabolite transporter (DMT)-like permease
MPTSASARPPQWQIIGAFAAIYFIWGSSFLFIRFALQTLPPFFIAGARFMLAGLILYAVVSRNQPRPSRVEWRSSFVLGFFMFLIGNGALMFAETLISSGGAATLYATVPLWFALLGWLWLRQERPNTRFIAGLVIGIIGVMLLVGLGDVGGLNPGGALLVIVSAIGWSFGSLLSRRMPMPRSALLGAAMNLFAGGVLLMIAALLTGEVTHWDWTTASLRSILSIGYLAIFPSVIAFGSYMWLLTVVSPNRVATYAYVNPVVAVFLGWAFAGEILTPRAIAASIIIIAAVVLITTARAAQRQPEPELTDGAAVPGGQTISS